MVLESGSTATTPIEIDWKDTIEPHLGWKVEEVTEHTKVDIDKELVS